MKDKNNTESQTIGIGVITYNRVDCLAKTIKKIKENTNHSYEIIVADDGSSDDTRLFLEENEINYVTGQNKGISWNKNRALFYLNNFTQADLYFIIEDDSYPIEPEWEAPWVEALHLWGHINLLPPWYQDKIVGGAGVPQDPYICRSLTAQVSAFTKEVISYCGYYDTRFKHYGFEHADHTIRIVKAGYGGRPIPTENPHEADFFYLSHGFSVDTGHSYYDEAHVAANGRVLDEVIKDEIHRPAWRGDDEMKEFRREITEALRRRSS
ncbi:glycosyltransferase family 2 protein [Azospirillum brasilense]|uniref:glycosyltransferase family 2 protein n=1 Tax=Azospirillum brasilense TaxID=192 RepID=UPI001EDBCE32|nr:glycosyltransferase [Azospirillum brasilense]UKJ78075.1 glycosyltransferase [Azospirillum brasilense]